MSRFDAIDLSKLPPPTVVEQLDFEAYLAAFKLDFVARAEQAGWDYDVQDLESDIAVKILEAAAYRETVLRALVNDKARAVMLALSLGTDLEQLGGLYKIGRQPGEDTERLRQRIHLAPEALSTCGNEGAYVHHAMRASVTIKDVHVWTIEGTGEVHVLPLVATGDGTPSSTIIAAVRDAVKPDGKNKGPLTDIVVVRAPVVTAYAVSLRLLVRRGPDPALIAATAKARVEAYVREQHRVGQTHYLNGMIAAAKVGGVENVLPVAPLSDRIPPRDQAFWCSGVSVSVEIVG